MQFFVNKNTKPFVHLTKRYAVIRCKRIKDVMDVIPSNKIQNNIRISTLFSSLSYVRESLTPTSWNFLLSFD